MELELSLGDSLAPSTGTSAPPVLTPTHTVDGEGHELVLELGVGTTKRAEQDNQKTPLQPVKDVQEEDNETRSHSDSPVELSHGCPLLPASAETGRGQVHESLRACKFLDGGESFSVLGSVNSEVCRRGFDVNTVPVNGDAAQARSLSAWSLQVEVPVQQAAEEAAEDEENGGVGGGARKKLRLSKEQSTFLEDSFKEHSTVTPEQKSNLANRLNLRPRQVEVWFQNRRARTKLKQTEADCEYLKRCCETLTQENRRLQREVAELRALRTTAYPFYSHLPAGFSAARVCPSCDNRVTTYSPVITAVSSPVVAPPSSMSTLFARPHFGPFSVHPVLRCQPSATS